MEESTTEDTTGSEAKHISGITCAATSEKYNSDNKAKEKLLNLTEASQLAGVSTATLMRFAEAGYFKVFSNDSEIKFCDSEIAQVFGVTFNYSKINHSTSDQSLKSSVSLNNSITDQSVTTNSEISSSSEIEDSASDYKTLASQIEVINENDSAPLEPTRNEQTLAQADESLEPFKKVLQLQEELLTQKNSVIADLIKERDWLRTRLEKMEQKSERDQMLLMVESQKVRNLIASDAESHNKLSTSNAGFLNKALAWFK